jgi:Domain of Unknown Function (DUF928)
MIESKFYRIQMLLALAGAMAIAIGAPIPARAGSIDFAPPEDAAPRDSSGGGIRGTIDFAPPGESAPSDSSSGGIRGDVGFQAPGEAAPSDSSSGGIRGEVDYQTPTESAPQSSIGGSAQANRASVVIPLLPDGRYGHTASARPTLLVYVPPTATRQVFFSVQDEDRNPVYQTVLNISGRGGVVSITLPESAPELETGKNYAWFFAPIEPNGTLRPDNYGVTGWMKRVDSPAVAIASTPVERAKAYAEAGIWYDTIAVLAAAQQADPQNTTLAGEWKDLLAQVGLEGVATQSVSDRL